ncbi:single-stranded-DNA-specific exonuclease RecJ [Desulfurispora thermophila]|uniref:single-stranded-DNA-specific exonuclease RecJ n=1 Tax=Desulfurispora thermophila TaxID=265470 RepID=UPI000368B9BE|nr:single-stranded-DNA-specific exonuclease RecJ [Desulfurispora thermophila]
MKKRLWQLRDHDPALQYIIARKLGLSSVTAGLLVGRGVCTAAEARHFISGDLNDLYPPLLLRDMARAVERLKQAVQRSEPVLVYGDYDVDGVTATALLVDALRSLNLPVQYYIPDRITQGYGLHRGALEQLIGQATLLVTVDCGISAREEVDWLNSAGVDVIITDHHEPPPGLPAALAVINPRCSDCQYPDKELAGVGVAFKLVQALFAALNRPPREVWRYLDLVCLGTVADVVPLRGENRLLVRYGLPALEAGNRPGIAALCRVAGVTGRALGTREVGFALAPRLNAAGRMGDAGPAVELLLTGDEARAQELAQFLQRANQERQQVENLVMAEAMGMVDGDPGLAGRAVLVLAGEKWHPGVIGIVAARLVEKYGRPVLLISLQGEHGKGSGRSVPGFHLYEALAACAQYLENYGGHEQAAGFTIARQNIAAFARAINHYAARLPESSAGQPVLELDALVSLPELSEELVNELALLSPYGYSNPSPLLACREVNLVRCRAVGKNGDHLKLTVQEDGVALDCIAFNLAAAREEIAAARAVDLAFAPAINEWQGRRFLQLEVKDIRPAAEWEERGRGRQGRQALRELAETAFWPEAAVYFWQHGREGAPSFLPPGVVAKYSLPAPLSKKHYPLRQHKIIKPRQSRYKEAALLDALRRTDGALVLVSSPADTVEVAALLRREFLAATCCHPGLPAEVRQQRWRAWRSGEYRVLVLTYGLLVPDRTADLVILYQLPWLPRHYQMALAVGEAVLTLYNRDDLAENQRLVAALVPSRPVLGELYRFLWQRRAGRVGVNELLNLPALAASGYAAGSLALTTAMTVLAQLGLVEFQRQGDTVFFSCPGERAKKDLERAKMFRLGRRWQEDTGRWCRSLIF